MHLGYKRFKLRKFLIKSLQDDGIQGRRLITTFIEQALVIVEPKNLTNARHPAILALPYSALEHFCPLKVIECDGVLRVPVFTFGFFVLNRDAVLPVPFIDTGPVIVLVLAWPMPQPVLKMPAVIILPRRVPMVNRLERGITESV